MDLLKTKQRIKKKNPSFVRQDAHKIGRVPSKWKKPRGIHSKMREQRRGYRGLVKPGYRTPRDLRHRDLQGRNVIYVRHQGDLANASSEDAIILMRTLGTRKKLALVEEALKKGFTITNLDPEAFREKQKAKQQERQQQKQKEQEAKQKAAKRAADKQAEKKESEAQEAVSDEEKKKREKQEKDKLLTQKDTGY